MENKYNITDAELEIMKELWENKQLSLNELTEKLNVQVITCQNEGKDFVEKIIKRYQNNPDLYHLRFLIEKWLRFIVLQ